ncbi:MAG: hypothetical protein EZS28_022995 [Streblomastix strix]|uniref:Uncharacterized protein n=1 Tax=Streblomastix strix TaxID=222440 RepID=A0A5J4VFX3_9EUKA|nr:MAG: hypothetical protein EZS28_022995 [Streblomastix strix]
MIKDCNASFSIASVKVSMYNLNRNKFKLYTIISQVIRNLARDYLYQYQFKGDATVQKRLLEGGYFRAKTAIIVAFLENLIESGYDVVHAFFDICIFFQELNYGREFNENHPNTPLFPPQPELIKLFNEQLEEEGSNEGIDSALFSSAQYDNIPISIDALQTMNIILNISKNLTNI